MAHFILLKPLPRLRASTAWISLTKHPYDVNILLMGVLRVPTIATEWGTLVMKKIFAPLVASALFLLPAAANGQQVTFDEFTSPPVTCCYGNPVQGPLFYPDVIIQDGFGGGTVMNGSGWAELPDIRAKSVWHIIWSDGV